MSEGVYVVSNFLSNNPNIRRGLISAAALALPLGGAACSSDLEKGTTPCDPELEVRYVNCSTAGSLILEDTEVCLMSTAPEQLAEVRDYYDSPERDVCVSFTLQDASRKLLEAYEASPDKFTVASFFTGTYGVTDENKDNFVSIYTKKDQIADPNAPTLSMYVFLGSDGKFDLSKGTILSVEADGRVATITPPTKEIVSGSGERHVNAISEGGIPDDNWKIDAMFPDDHDAEVRHLQEVSYSKDPEVHRSFEQDVVDQINQAVAAL